MSNSLQIVPRTNKAAERPAHLIRLAVPRLNKNATIGEYLSQIPTRDYDLNWAEVTETRKMTVAEWNEFVMNLMNDREWLADKGGANNWDSQYDGMTDIQVCNLDKDRRAEFQRTVYLLVIAVACECTGQTIYIDPEGYNYARYVAFAAPDSMTDGKTRAERERDRAQAAIVERKARIAHQIANPPAVPDNHGLRFFWNGIKANGGELQRAYYSLGNLYDYPADTLSVNARDYGSFSPEVSACFHISNATDIYMDFHDHDHVRVCSNHPLYALVMEAYRAQEMHEEKRRAKRMGV